MSQKSNDFTASVRLNQDESDSLKANAYLSERCKVIGRNMRIERKKRGFSLDNLSEYISLSASYVGLLERGERCPSLKILLSLCDLFDVTPNDLLLDRAEIIAASGEFKEKAAKTKTGDVKNNKYKSVLSLIHNMDESHLDYAITILKGLRKLRPAETEIDDTGIIKY